MQNWILGAIQKAHVSQRFRRTAPAWLTRLLKSMRIEKSDSYCVEQWPRSKLKDIILFSTVSLRRLSLLGKLISNTVKLR
ncbi:hypothetical protein ACJVXU_16150, partial [Staphylococcus pseudintermedius]